MGNAKSKGKKAAEPAATEGQDQVAWHSLAVTQVLERLETSLDGLSPEEATARLER
jgi:hypothetical protein